MLGTIKAIFGMTMRRPQKATEATNAQEAIALAVYARRALEELEWLSEQAYWERLRDERQAAIELVAFERERAAIGARQLAAKRQAWSKRMHAAKAAKHAAKKKAK
jgi:hypothetical protein